MNLNFILLLIMVFGGEMDISTVIPLSTYYSYLKRFVISPTTMGTIAPSSRWLCYEMLDKLNWQRDIQIAELGAGTGLLPNKY